MRTRERRSGFNNLLILIAGCVLFFAVFALQIRTKAQFRPVPASYAEGEGIVRIAAEDGLELAAQWRPVAGSRWTVIYFHDNGEDIGAVLPTLASYQLAGVSTLCFDYRGFGLTGGVATEKNTLADAGVVYRYAVETLGVPAERVVLHGRGLGASVALHVAAAESPAGLIAESAYLSLLRLYLPVRWLPGDRFVNTPKARRLRCPTLFIHGRLNDVVPFEHGEKLAAAVPEGLVETLWIEDAGHEDLGRSPTSPYWQGIRGFLRKLASEAGSAVPK